MPPAPDSSSGVAVPSAPRPRGSTHNGETRSIGRSGVMDNLFASFDYKPFPNPPSDSRCVLTRAAAAATRTQQIRRFEHRYKQIEERHAEPVYLRVTSALDPSLSATVTFIIKKLYTPQNTSYLLIILFILLDKYCKIKKKN